MRSPINLRNIQFVNSMHTYRECECRMQDNMYNLLLKHIFFLWSFKELFVLFLKFASS